MKLFSQQKMPILLKFDRLECKLNFIQHIIHEGTLCSDQYLGNLYCLTIEKFSGDVVESPS